MLTTGTGASGEMRVTSPQINSSSITSPNTALRHRAALVRISRTRFLVKVNQVTLRMQSLRFRNSIDCSHDALDRYRENALRLFKFSTRIAVTRLARQLFAHDFAFVRGPGSPVGDVRRSKYDDAGRVHRRRGVRDAAVIADE